MIVDLAEVREIQAPDGAVVIVGSGAAGLALTDRVTAAGRPVVLLESGDDVARMATGSASSDDLNAGTVTGLGYAGLQRGRTRVLGGAAQLWHGQCMRLYDYDVQPRTWIKDSGWPIPFAEIEASYADAERWLGVTGLGYGAERWHEHPRLNPLDWDRDHLLHDFTEYVRRPMLGSVHRAALEANPLAHVFTHATVTRVLVDGDRVRGVEVARPDATRVEIAGHQVVLAGGTIENARMMQLSDPDGIGLGDGRDHVGRYLQDHPVIDTADVVAHDYRVLQDRYIALHRGKRRLFPKVRLAPHAQREHGLLDATAVFVHEHQQPSLAAARRLVLAARARQRPEHALRDVLAASRAPVPVVRDAYRRYVRGLASGTRPHRVYLQIWLEQQPDRDSRVSLGSATDALGLRRAEVHWRTGDLEIETSRRMTEWIGADLDRLGVARLRPNETMHDDEAWRGKVVDAFHPSGTTRMSADGRTGVVDTDLKVHGLQGLFAVGGSVFPIAGYANPTLTIVALAVRLGDRLTTKVGAGRA